MCYFSPESIWDCSKEKNIIGYTAGIEIHLSFLFKIWLSYFPLCKKSGKGEKMQNYVWFEIHAGEYTHISYSYNSHLIQFLYDSDIMINLNIHIILI